MTLFVIHEHLNAKVERSFVGTKFTKGDPMHDLDFEKDGQGYRGKHVEGC